MNDSQPLPLEAFPDGVTLLVKVTPGASRTRISGMLGDRLKVAVAAPPESGKANRALCDLLAETFNVPPRCVQVVSGQTQALKRVQIERINLCDATECLQTILKA